jgi:hypothetical protein
MVVGCHVGSCSAVYQRQPVVNRRFRSLTSAGDFECKRDFATVMIITPSLRCTVRQAIAPCWVPHSTRNSLNNPFLLTKWYMDCVAENGDALILYVADLRWNALTVHYGSLLTVLGGRVGSTSSLRRHATPQVRDGTIEVNLPHLDIEGTWRGVRSPIQRTIFESEHGSVDWHCLQPMSQVDLLLRGTTRLTGRG